MKKMIVLLAVVTNLSAIAEGAQRIICHEDLRLDNGPLREIVLTVDENNNYFVQTSYIASLNAPDIVVERWATNLACKIDEKAPIAYCQDQASNSIQIREKREVYYDSLDEEAKKKTHKSVDISLFDNGIERKSSSFAASDCQSFGA
jgi:hypothetical protein